MKALKIINMVILTITILLYITIYYGLYSQILLGIVQIVSSLILGLNYRKLILLNQKRLKSYWLFVAIYFSGWLLPWGRVLDNSYGIVIAVIGVIFIPMALAIYFQIILMSIKK
ncbi:hypothetical protein [Seonamhaeicola marinus]|uniref:Uncharacterized protein n=1 Tax=Seonamhaeicola marinus TaxID=1912246 RepID=A0A5D0HET2_9FLAO|nr:hypothetical protein [Seonamhaeicola marinus]TYA69825.1 hypothetical protein FUA24_21255 [Seonamhaeicola marinus]